MQKITQDSIAQLLELQASPKVTLFIPLEASAAPPHITENQIRLKNLIHEAVKQLDAMGEDSKLGKELCAYLDEHHDNMDFWKSQSPGLLICAAPGQIQAFSLPVDTEEYVAVDEMFHLAPVLALLNDAREYYVLALAQQSPKLYKGDMYGLEEAGIALPVSMRVGLGIDEPNQKSENQGSATGSSLNTGWFNGRGGARDPMDNDRVKFFHLIDKILHDKADRNMPLVLAGIDAENAEFRDLSKYQHILQGTVTGNHTETRPKELFEKVHPIIMEELVMPEHAAALEEYERLSGANPDRVAGDEKSIVAAAEQGRIDKLLAMMSRHTTDTVQDKVQSVLRISFPEPARSKKLNNLAMQVWQMSGKIISLLPSEMPNGAPMVARLRY
ncbi:MAG TPA: hypothetical protein VK978_00775 [Candidatus Saccharimonadales bacterium]|nr:hypothetical protein [Candidatus Saccharimonadales bacterium]